jgi:hypothetical protein
LSFPLNFARPGSFLRIVSTSELSVTSPASPGAGATSFPGQSPTVAAREASESPAGSLVTEVLLMVGDHRPGEFVSEKHETRLRP